MILQFKYIILLKLLNLISKTWRFETNGNFPTDIGIVAFWHGYMLPVWKYFAKYSPTAIVSQSKDGEILSTILELWGYELARGSSSKGGKEALDLLIEKAKSKLVLITPDGPRGPYHNFKAGAVITSYRTQNELYLCKVLISNKYVFKKSWDKFEFPLPFSKIVLHFQHPIILNKNASRDEIDEIIKDCEKILNED